MLHFQRRTLWIIIYVTIPLVIILNNLDGTPDNEHVGEVSGSDLLWSLDELTVEQQGGIAWLDLRTAKSVELSVILNAIPTTSLALPNSTAFASYFQGGKFVISVTNPVNEAAFDESLKFIAQWVPADIEAIVVSGPYSSQWVELIQKRLQTPKGEGLAISFAAGKGLARLASPAMSSPDQLAFLMAVSILKQRLSGYNIQMAWDHRRSESQVTFNSTLSEDAFYPVTQEEFEPVHRAFSQSASVRERSQLQLHKYLQTAMIYELPFSFFVEQPSRLAAVKVEDVNRMMEFALEQVKTR
ncbi:hypothetical protein [Reinekea sp.]|jgi:hypothetical protein|uniref:hypothetical protein n=1 Tax=Reinekea sp. TaxID=1970455 RepID=UPI003989558F